MKSKLIMTPGPTYIHEEVRKAMSMEITNPDLDVEFYEYYKETCDKLKSLINTQNDVLILCGEGILGLEAACASIIEPGDRVLCIDNGVFGNGFGDFIKLYGGEAVYFKGDYRKGIDINELEEFLKEDNNFKAATLVHCETPSGITNPIDRICPLLNQYGILSIVDSVSGIGGEIVKVDEWKVDIILGGSQKCLSAPPGLTFLSISKDAWNKILNRKAPIASYYANLSIWRSYLDDKRFPYTQPISDIFALRVALERALKEDTGLFSRHEIIAEAVRESFKESGMELHALDSHSSTVTTVIVPEGIEYKTLFNEMVEKHGIMIAGSLGFLKDKAFRIGHMGENCYEGKVYVTLKALNQVFKENGVKLKADLHRVFVDKMQY
jgi:aspartate aminotransferase-like enzyme